MSIVFYKNTKVPLQYIVFLDVLCQFDRYDFEYNLSLFAILFVVFFSQQRLEKLKAAQNLARRLETKPNSNSGKCLLEIICDEQLRTHIDMLSW